VKDFTRPELANEAVLLRPETDHAHRIGQPSEKPD
jgi:hypothetical protein